MYEELAISILEVIADTMGDAGMFDKMFNELHGEVVRQLELHMGEEK
jgi:hypothetical protein